jgi:hypothetical protein
MNSGMKTLDPPVDGDVIDRPAALGDRVAALMIDVTNRRQVLVLGEAGGPHPIHVGRGSIRPRLLALETGSPGELDLIEQRLAHRQALLGRRRTQAWEGIVGVDPDRIEVTVSAHPDLRAHSKPRLGQS